jgi:hypothetical protein
MTARTADQPPRLMFELILADKDVHFEAGEILLIDARDNTEVVGARRRPSRWTWTNGTWPLVFPTAVAAVEAARARGLTAKVPAGYQQYHPSITAAIESIVEATR